VDPFLVVIILLFALGGVGFILSRKTASKAKKLGAREYSVAVHMHGLPSVPQHNLTNLFFTDEKIIIEANGNSFELSYSQITAAESVRKSDLLKKDKSVIGRAIVGTILPFGLVGTLVGAISGVGQKKIKGDFLVLNYCSSGGSEPKVLVFDIKNYAKAHRMANFVKSKFTTAQTVTL
jgi:hypothetical protein